MHPSQSLIRVLPISSSPCACDLSLCSTPTTSVQPCVMSVDLVPADSLFPTTTCTEPGERERQGKKVHHEGRQATVNFQFLLLCYSNAQSWKQRERERERENVAAFDCSKMPVFLFRSSFVLTLSLMSSVSLPPGPSARSLPHRPHHCSLSLSLSFPFDTVHDSRVCACVDVASVVQQFESIDGPDLVILSLSSDSSMSLRMCFPFLVPSLPEKFSS